MKIQLDEKKRCLQVFSVDSSRCCDARSPTCVTAVFPIWGPKTVIDVPRVENTPTQQYETPTVKYGPTLSCSPNISLATVLLLYFTGIYRSSPLGCAFITAFAFSSTRYDCTCAYNDNQNLVQTASFAKHLHHGGETTRDRRRSTTRNNTHDHTVTKPHTRLFVRHPPSAHKSMFPFSKHDVISGFYAVVTVKLYRS